MLDTVGFWRMHHTLKPPVVQHADGLKPLLLKQYWLNSDTASPAPEWRSVDFDDGSWLRGPARMSLGTPYLARLCLRGKFAVTDPAQVKGLRLSVEYHGGVIVSVNGQEVCRGNVPAGAAGDDLLADGYPEAAFVNAKGELITYGVWRATQAKERNRMHALRRRSVTDIAIPPKVLRKGVNVVAIEIVRAPYSPLVQDKEALAKAETPVELSWHTCELLGVHLVADAADGLVPNVTRACGFQAWNSNLLMGDLDMDFADPNERPGAIELVGVRGGAFSGKVVVGSDTALRGLEAQAGDLKGDAGAIPASAIQVRYGIPWGGEYVVDRDRGVRPYPAAPALLGALAESPPTEVPVVKKRPANYAVTMPKGMAPVFGAVVPVWVTVTVPKTARAGTYAGRLTIRAQGVKPLAVPVSLKVVDWALPETQDRRAWVELMQSPDTLAMEYKLTPWSGEHFRMIARSFDFIGRLGSRVVYVPLICHTNMGNEESMVRWIPEDDGTYDYDFSIMDRYLDTAVEHMGKPKMVVFNIWDVYMVPKDKQSRGAEANAIRYLKERRILLGEGPAVTVLHGDTGKTETAYLPRTTNKVSEAMWAPLFSQLRERMRKRGLEDVMMVGMLPDVRPSKEEFEAFNRITSNLPWVVHSHHGAGATVHGVGRVGYRAQVWNISFCGYDPSKGRKYGWKNKVLVADYERHGSLNTFPGTHWRHLVEYNISGTQRGAGRIGADFWKSIRDKRGQRKGQVWARYPQSSWRNLDLYSSLLAPGPRGPVATTRYEIFREGVQECEARIVIEQALTEAKLKEALGPDLARRCQEAMDERLLCLLKGLSNLRLSGPRWRYVARWRDQIGVDGHMWFIGSGWERRTERLYRLASEVDRKLNPR